MSKKNNKGKALPDLRKCGDTVTVDVEYPEEVNELDDCCTLLKIGERALFYQKMREDYYWLFFVADRDDVMTCHLEGFAKARQEDWTGRCADYLAVSKHREICYILVIEIRQEIGNCQHLKDKQDQVEQSMNKVLELLKDKIATSEHLPPICASSRYSYKILGFIVPATFCYKKKEKINWSPLKMVP